MSKLRDMKKRFLPLSMLLITMVLAQASFVANAAGIQGKYNPRTASKATISSFMKSIRANQETGLIDPADLIAAQKAVQTTKDDELNWKYAGPDNFGGLTRAVVYDKNGDVVIGTIGGDIYKTENDGITFRKIASIGYPISCMIMNSNGDIFIGTGDGREAHNLNGLAELGFETSFIGNGIYKMSGSNINKIPATSDWLFVNEMAIADGKIYAATENGLMVSTDETGTAWEVTTLTSAVRSVKANNNGDVLAACMFDGKKIYKITNITDTVFSTVSNVYLKKVNGEFTQITGTAAFPYTTLKPNSDSTNWTSSDSLRDYNQKIIAVSPTNPDYMYIACLAGTIENYSTGDFFFTQDGGESWNLAMAGSSLYNIFGSDANHEGMMVVYPDNPRRLLVGSDNLWSLIDATETGVFRPQEVSDYFVDEYTAIAWNRYLYLHQGIQNIVFNPSNPNEFFVGTNGGVFKGLYKAGVYSYRSSNRYFISDDEHCSATRVMNVGIGGGTKILAASLDHGTIKIVGNANINNVTTGEIAFPHITNNSYVSSYFTKSYAGGPCAISTINPKMLFISATGNLSTPIYRTETDAEDFDQNFEGGGDDPVVTNANAFRTPIVLFENYNDANNPIDTIYAPIRTVKHKGDTVFAYSIQSGYPIDHIITEEPAHDPEHQDEEGNYVWIPGDTIRGIHDPISTLYLCGVEGTLYMTRDALIFNKATEWLEAATIDGLPTSIAVSNDGDMAFVGTAEGKLYKVTGLATTFSEDDLANLTCTVVYEFTDRNITSVSVDPRNKSKVVVTLGNYGNDAYVYVSEYAGAAFVSIQGTLPKAPVYSSLIEKTTGTILVGTETGIYERKNGAWRKTGNMSSPVMEIKQALVANHDTKIDVLYDEVGDTTHVTYPGVFNEGMIYAATYGEGIVYCDTYAVIQPNENNTTNDDNNVTVNEEEMLNVYPNPVKDYAQININLDNDATVSYVIYDLAGRLITNEDLGTYVKGMHTLNINTNELTTGSYIIRIKAGDKTETSKFLVY